MTTYLHTIVLTDSERIALDEVLSLMIHHCEEQLAQGAGAPFGAHLEDCRVIIGKLAVSTPVMMSTYIPGDESARVR